MKLRLAKKILMCPWNKVSRYRMKEFCKGSWVQNDNHRLQKAATVIRKWRKNKCK